MSTSAGTKLKTRPTYSSEARLSRMVRGKGVAAETQKEDETQTRRKRKKERDDEEEAEYVCKVQQHSSNDNKTSSSLSKDKKSVAGGLRHPSLAHRRAAGNYSGGVATLGRSIVLSYSAPGTGTTALALAASTTPPSTKPISWTQIIDRFTDKYNDVFLKQDVSRKAHLDGCGPENKVIDGAKEKWAAVTLLDSLVCAAEALNKAHHQQVTNEEEGEMNRAAEHGAGRGRWFIGSTSQLVVTTVLAVRFDGFSTSRRSFDQHKALRSSCLDHCLEIFCDSSTEKGRQKQQAISSSKRRRTTSSTAAEKSTHTTALVTDDEKLENNFSTAPSSPPSFSLDIASPWESFSSLKDFLLQSMPPKSAKRYVAAVDVLIERLVSQAMGAELPELLRFLVSGMVLLEMQKRNPGLLYGLLPSITSSSSNVGAAAPAKVLGGGEKSSSSSTNDEQGENPKLLSAATTVSNNGIAAFLHIKKDEKNDEDSTTSKGSSFSTTVAALSLKKIVDLSSTSGETIAPACCYYSPRAGAALGLGGGLDATSSEETDSDLRGTNSRPLVVKKSNQTPKVPPLSLFPSTITSSISAKKKGVVLGTVGDDGDTSSLTSSAPSSTSGDDDEEELTSRNAIDYEVDMFMSRSSSRRASSGAAVPPWQPAMFSPGEDHDDHDRRCSSAPVTTACGGPLRPRPHLQYQDVHPAPPDEQFNLLSEEHSFMHMEIAPPSHSSSIIRTSSRLGAATADHCVGEQGYGDVEEEEEDGHDDQLWASLGGKASLASLGCDGPFLVGYYPYKPIANQQEKLVSAKEYQCRIKV